MGNICGESAYYRDKVLEDNNVIESLLPFLNISNPYLYTAMWTFQNMCRHDNKLELEMFVKAIPYIALIFLVTEEDDIKEEALWALAYLVNFAKTTNELEFILQTTGISKKVIDLLDSENAELKQASLKLIIDVIYTGNQQQLEIFISSNSCFYQSILQLLDDRNGQTCLVIANLACESQCIQVSFFLVFFFCLLGIN